MLELNRYIDQYCERLLPGLWAEPLNLLSNASFLIFACIAAVRIHKTDFSAPIKSKYYLLAIMAFIVGIGSALFHSFATLWAQLADVIPIAILLFTFIGMHCKLSLGMSWKATIAALLAFLIVTVSVAKLVDKELVGGSNLYFGTAIALAAMSWNSRIKNQKSSAGYFFFATLAFSISLVFRSIDLKICSAWPLGTHFLWHTLNGLTIYLAIVATLNARKAT